MKLKNKTDVLVSESSQFLFVQPAEINAINQHLTAIGLIERTQDLKQSGFSGTTWTDNRNNFSFVYHQIYSFKHFQLAEAFMYIFCMYHFPEILCKVIPFRE
jgi:hypothetical protein